MAAASINEVRLIGNLGSDPELKSLPGDKTVASFRLATSETWRTAEGKDESRTDWHNIEVWGAQAKSCGEFLTKGRRVFVAGALRTDVWADRANPELKHSRTKVVTSRVIFLDAPEKGPAVAQR